MKKSIFGLLMALFATTAVLAEKCNLREAYKINIFKEYHSVDLFYGRSSTLTINGVNIWNMLHGKEKMNSDGVCVTRQLSLTTFGTKKDLVAFKQKKLQSAYSKIISGRIYLEEPSTEPHSLLVTSLWDRECVLCINEGKKIIVTHAQGEPEQVCEMLRREDLDKSYKSALSMAIS